MGLFACISQALCVATLIRHSSALPQQTPNDIIKSNGYTVQHCGTLTPFVQKALENIYDVLPAAIEDTHYGTTSAPYQAFFKSSFYEIVVETVLKATSIGAPEHLGPDGGLLAPRIVCALKPDIVIIHEAGREFDLYDVCTKKVHWTTVYYPESSDIFICPTFFWVPQMPSTGGCPTVNETTNQLEGNLASFMMSQMYLLLHEIIHFYLGTTFEDAVAEIMDWNYAFSLSPKKTTLNALNYVLYVASVDKDCREFPQANESQPFHGRRLGTTLDLLNTTSVEMPDSEGTRSVRVPFHTEAMNVNLAGKNLTF